MVLQNTRNLALDELIGCTLGMQLNLTTYEKEKPVSFKYLPFYYLLKQANAFHTIQIFSEHESKIKIKQDRALAKANYAADAFSGN